MKKADSAYYEAIEAASQAKLDQLQLLEILRTALLLRDKGSLAESARLYERVLHIMMSYQEATLSLKKKEVCLPAELLDGIEGYADLLAAMERPERLLFVQEKLQAWRQRPGASASIQLKLRI